LPEQLLEEIRRFRLGLYVMSRRDDGGFAVREEIEPDLQNPQPAELNSLLEYFLGDDPNLLRQYKLSIGRG
jgi:predicted methyltransferase